MKVGPSKTIIHQKTFCRRLKSGYFQLPHPLPGLRGMPLRAPPLTFSFPQTQTAMMDPGAGQCPGEFRAAPTSGGRVLPPLFPAAYPPATKQCRFSHNPLIAIIFFGGLCVYIVLSHSEYARIKTDFTFSFYDRRRCANCSARVVQTSV